MENTLQNTRIYVDPRGRFRTSRPLTVPTNRKLREEQAALQRTLSRLNQEEQVSDSKIQCALAGDFFSGV